MKLINIILLFVFINSPVFAGNKPYGPTLQKDTLWAIASQYKINDASMSQTMVAFHRLNPNAFFEGNINRLKQGIYLNVPSAQLIKNIDPNNAQLIVDKKIIEYNKFYKEFSAKPIMVEPLISKALVIEPSKKAVIKEAVAIKPVAQLAPKDIASINVAPVKKANSAEQSEVERHDEIMQKSSTQFNFGKPLKYRFSYDVSVSFDDNMRLAENDVDIREDTILNAILKTGTSIKLSKFSRLNVSTKLEFEKFKTFNTLDNLKYSLNIRYATLSSTGFSAPLYILDLSVGGIESNSDMRTSDTFKLGLSVSKRMTNRIHLTSGILFDKRESQSSVFDTQKQTLFINVDYSYSPRSILYGTYHYIDGDSVSSATPTLNVINAAEAIEADDAFGGIDFNQFAYKLDSTTQVLTFGINHKISRKLSYDLSLRIIDNEATKNSDITYDRNIVRIGILGKF